MRNKLIVLTVAWLLPIYLMVERISVSQSISSNRVVAFFDIKPRLEPNSQNWRSIADSRADDDWIRTTNVVLVASPQDRMVAHCKMAASLCKQVRSDPESRISGRALRLALEPGSWIVAAGIGGREILAVEQQTKLLKDELRRRDLLALLSLGFAVAWSAFSYRAARLSSIKGGRR